MNEWNVVLVIISLVGLGGAIIGPILKLNTAIVKLTEAVKELQKDMGDFVNGNHNSHVRIHERIDSCGVQLKEHEIRLERLEADK
ncbi:MAG: hypothetical protein J6C75_00035 [Oscillospiraceae bacterium]|nr:hypothetical protein [Oscillospiraceae bacterium]